MALAGVRWRGVPARRAMVPSVFLEKYRSRTTHDCIKLERFRATANADSNVRMRT